MNLSHCLRLVAALLPAALAHPFTATAQPEDSALVVISERITRLMNKPGVSIGIAVQSEFSSSNIGMHNPDTLYTRESEAFTQGDLLFVGRPVESIAASAVLRLRSDWASFYSHPVDEITTRWVSVDGAAGDFLDFHIGDYRSAYTPFTIGISHPRFYGEPFFMRDQRRRELREYYLFDDKRPFEGVNLDFHFRLPGSLEADINAQGARLASVDGIDSKIFDRTAFDRLMTATRPQVAWGDRLEASYNGLAIFDLDATNYNNDQYALSNTVNGGTVALKFGAGALAPFIDATRFDVELNRSRWKKSWAGNDTALDRFSESLTGDALKAGATITLGAGLGELSLEYLDVAPGYRSLTAQSPSVNWAVRDAYLLNTNFERRAHFATGLYYSHFGRFATRYNTAGANIYGRSETKYNGRFSTPFMMSIYSPVDLHEQLTNLALDPVQPLGEATYDRKGVSGSLEGSPRPRLSYALNGALLRNSDEVAFHQAGAELEAGMASPFSFARLPWKITVGVGLSGIDGTGVVQTMQSTVVALDHTGKYTTPVRKELVIEDEHVSSSMVSAGFSAGIFGDLSLIGGAQILDSKFDYVKIFDVFDYDPWLDGMRVTATTVKFGRNYRETADNYRLRQLHFGGGLQWKASDRVSLRFDLRRIGYYPLDPSKLVRTHITRIEETVDGQVVSRESTDPAETYVLPPVEEYKITTTELIFDYHF